MYARVTPNRTSDPSKREEVLRLVDENVVPALQQMPGFKGYLALYDEHSGRGLAVTLWETKDQADSLGTTSAGRDLLLRFEDLGMAFETPEIYEVVKRA